MKSITSAGWPAPAAPEPRAQRGPDPSAFDLALDAAERHRRDDASREAVRHDHRHEPAREAVRHDHRREPAREAAEPKRRDTPAREPAAGEPHDGPVRDAAEPKPRRRAADDAAEPTPRRGAADDMSEPARDVGARDAAEPKRRTGDVAGPQSRDEAPVVLAAAETSDEASVEEKDETDVSEPGEDEASTNPLLAALFLFNPPQPAEALASPPLSPSPGLASAAASAPTAALASGAAQGRGAGASGLGGPSAGLLSNPQGGALAATGETPAAPSSRGAQATSQSQGARVAASLSASSPAPTPNTTPSATARPIAASGAAGDPATSVATSQPTASASPAASSAVASALASATLLRTLGPSEGGPGVAAAGANVALPPGTRVGLVDPSGDRQSRGRASGVDLGQDALSMASSEIGARRFGDLPHQIVSFNETISVSGGSPAEPKNYTIAASAVAGAASQAQAIVAKSATIAVGVAARAGKGAASAEGEPLALPATAEGLVSAEQAATEATPSLGAAPTEGPLALGIGVTSRSVQDTGAVATARAPAAAGEAVPARVEAGEDERHRLVAAGVNRLALRHGLRAEADVPELGRVSVEARSTAEGTIDLRVSAADPAAAAALGRHRGELVQTLEASSVPLGRVSIDAQGQGASSFQHAHSQAQSHAQSQAQTQGQFQGGGKSGREGTQARPEADRNDDRSAQRPGRSRVRVVLLGEPTVSVSSLRTTSDNGLLGGTTGSGSSGSSGSAAAPAMDKDAFLKLLVAQISHQDPLKPMEGTEFVTQLAQFSAVEQAMQQSQRLELLSAQMSGLANNAATDLVGKTVTLRGKSVAFDGVTATGASVTLGGAAESVKVTVRDASGKAVRTLDLGAKPAGALAVTWDGKDDAGQPVSAGSYSLEVQAKNADGAAVSVSQDVQGVVMGVFFDKGYPEILLDSGVRAPISDLIGVVGQAAPSSP